MLFRLWRSIKQKRLGNTDLVHPQCVCVDQFGLVEICITLCQESERSKEGLGCGKLDCGKVSRGFIVIITIEPSWGPLMSILRAKFHTCLSLFCPLSAVDRGLTCAIISLALGNSA